MNELRQAINHSQITSPSIFWTDDYIYRGNDVGTVWKLWKQTYLRWNKYCKIKHILDSSGKCFVIDRFEEIPARSEMAAFFRRKYWQTWVTPIITSEKQLNLEEFKKEVIRAVKSKHRYDRDGMIVERTMEKLPNASTYLEVIESLPNLI
jgi:hypothetical protein